MNFLSKLFGKEKSVKSIMQKRIEELYNDFIIVFNHCLHKTGWVELDKNLNTIKYYFIFNTNLGKRVIEFLKSNNQYYFCYYNILCDDNNISTIRSCLNSIFDIYIHKNHIDINNYANLTEQQIDLAIYELEQFVKGLIDDYMQMNEYFQKQGLEEAK